jgi:signal transduction histidine kinase
LRVVQEAAANVVRHAAASHVRVRLAYSGRQLTVSVTDDGVGFHTASDKGAATMVPHLTSHRGPNIFAPSAARFSSLLKTHR